VTYQEGYEINDHAILARFQPKASSAWMEAHLTGRLRYPRSNVYLDIHPGATLVPGACPCLIPDTLDTRS